MPIFNLSSRHMEHVLHSVVVSKLYVHMTFWSVYLHHCYFCIIQTHLCLNPIVNFICGYTWDHESKRTHYLILPFTHFVRTHPVQHTKPHFTIHFVVQHQHSCSHHSHSRSAPTTLPFGVSKATHALGHFRVQQTTTLSQHPSAGTELASHRPRKIIRFHLVPTL